MLILVILIQLILAHSHFREIFFLLFFLFHNKIDSLKNSAITSNTFPGIATNAFKPLDNVLVTEKFS